MVVETLKYMNKEKTLRVRFYGLHMDDIFDGTVVDTDETNYFVKPDENKNIVVKWFKDWCEIL